MQHILSRKPKCELHSTTSSKSKILIEQQGQQICFPNEDTEHPITFHILLQRALKATILFICAVLIIYAMINKECVIRIHPDNENCQSYQQCLVTIVESIPENLTYPPGSISFATTFSAWKQLLSKAENSIDIAEFYFSLRNEDVTPVKMASSWQGEEIFKEILDAGSNRDISIRIAQNSPSSLFPQNDSYLFEKDGNAQVRSLNFDHLLGAGVLHTKLLIVDEKHVYIGSANMDWQSLTQVKELGLMIQNCSCIATDMKKIFEVYWYLGQEGAEIPSVWPSYLQTSFNIAHKMHLTVDDIKSDVFISSSPLPFNPEGRTNDIDAIISIIRSAKKFIYIAVMDYFPRLLYSKKGKKFWPVIDDELRRAALERSVHVRLLASHWNHSRSDLVRWLISLEDISGLLNPSVNVETKLFIVPSYTDDQKKLSFARVNHNKYMVTDKTAYVGTSNWSGDYFINTAGVSVSISQNASESKVPTLCADLQKLFERDWFSEYSKPSRDFIAA